MKYLLLSLVLLCAGCTAIEVQPKSVRAEAQTDPWTKNWWMPRHEEKLALKVKMEQVDLVFIGDSITHSFDDKGKSVWQQYYQSRNALNLGFSGDRTEQVLWRLEHGEVDNIDPKLVVLMIGTNNTGHRQDKPEDTALGIKKILTSINDKLPNSKILLLAVFPRGATTDDPLRKINDDINNIISTYGDGEKVHYLDINHIFLDANGNLSRSVMKDLLHPNKEQYKNWAMTIEPKVKQLMAN
ncbi:GDSL-type esterase/lipase family protein [Thalassotalea nanhaiensis]|uniref:GDSL-type esterase/lipase family protein n=1 Tax=Thalassotalea nanhaiensis TaxID=3065648 RepID=A0ABY9TLI2_9GAMM|nr:GDSL-type esterase/lipase family protein [Colwelliaceae bacterium SQ345]